MMKFFTGVVMLFSVPSVVPAQSLQQAKQLIYHERFNSAEKILHDVLKSDPGNAEAWYALAQAYMLNNKFKEIKDSLQLAPQQVKDEALFKSAYGHILLKENDSVAAKQNFDMALKDSRMKDPLVLAEIAGAYINTSTGDAHYAITLLQKAIKKDKDNPALYVLLGDAYRKLIDGGNAYKAYQQALAKDEKYAAADYKIGKIYTSQNNPQAYLPYFEKAVSQDSSYAPALYELYYYYYYKDINRARDFLAKYIAASDYDIKNDYLHTDMLYASGKFDEAIKNADELMQKEGPKVQPRLYKLIAYSYKELGNTAKASGFMNAYFNGQNDTGFIAKDYEAMGDIYSSFEGKEDSAAYYFAKGAGMEKEDAVKAGYYKKISELYKKIKDYNNEARWLGKYYAVKPSPSNVDLFNWGLASYLGKDYPGADTVFALYEKKYPQEDYGFYWRARTNAAIDTSMELGIAVPHYMNLIALLEKDTTDSKTNKKHLIEAYGYIAAYKANAQKDYETAVSYFEKLLLLDPGNNDAKRYTEILKKNLAKNAASASAGASAAEAAK